LHSSGQIEIMGDDDKLGIELPDCSSFKQACALFAVQIAGGSSASHTTGSVTSARATATR